MHEPSDFTLRFEVEPQDVQQVRGIVGETGFFQLAEIEIAVELVEERLAKHSSSGYEFVLADAAEGLAGYTCFGEIPCTIGSYDIYWIVVSPRFQRQGLGRTLMRVTEQRITQRRGRKVYIDTSGRPQYQPSRSFYAKCGYVPLANLPDFYDDGDAKIIFSKVLSVPAKSVV